MGGHITLFVAILNARRKTPAMSTSRERKPPVGEPIGRSMPHRLIGHLRGNAVGYVALFAALGGTSYAAVNLEPGSVGSAAIARSAVTHSKLAARSVTQTNLVKHSLSAAVFKAGTLKKIAGANGDNGAAGPTGPAGTNGKAGPTGPAGADGNASIVMRSQGTGTVTAPHGASTDIPLSGATWTQGANDLNLITGSVTIKTPASCTGSFGNSVLVSVDGTTTTFGVAPNAPVSSDVTVPIAVGELMEPGASTPHQITAKLASSCTKDGEDYTVTGAKLDVLSFH
jgi:hypothetical protein